MMVNVPIDKDGSNIHAIRNKSTMFKLESLALVWIVGKAGGFTNNFGERLIGRIAEGGNVRSGKL
jgi:hypothetical protein